MCAQVTTVSPECSTSCLGVHGTVGAKGEVMVAVERSKGGRSGNTRPLYTHQDGPDKKRWTMTYVGHEVEK